MEEFYDRTIPNKPGQPYRSKVHIRFHSEISLLNTVRIYIQARTFDGRRKLRAEGKYFNFDIEILFWF